jgi:hypothetical protein
MASATTAQLSSKSCFNEASFKINLFKPFKMLEYEIRECAKGTPMFLKTVLSVKSLCKRDTGSFTDKCSSNALAIPKFPSAFSKSIGFTLCGMAEDPTSPAFNFCLK